MFKEKETLRSSVPAGGDGGGNFPALSAGGDGVGNIPAVFVAPNTAYINLLFVGNLLFHSFKPLCFCPRSIATQAQRQS